MVTATSMGAFYGIEVCEKDDTHRQIFERMVGVAEDMFLPGDFPVETFPALLCLFRWFPGGGFKTWAEEARRDIAYGVDFLLAGAKAAVSA